MFIVKSGFIWNFLHGDNIIYNLDILSVLYKNFDSLEYNDKRRLCKPIIIILVSIIESVVYDLLLRIKESKNEIPSNIPNLMINDILTKDYNDFSKVLDLCYKYNIFEFKNKEIYKVIHDLRKLRNRIHIQNEKNYSLKREYKAFTFKQKENAEILCEHIFKLFYSKFKRNEEYHLVNDFKFPWDEKIYKKDIF